MELLISEIKEFNVDSLSGIAELWAICFGDSKEFVYSFYEKMPVHSTVCVYNEDIPVSMAVLLSVSGNMSGYYGYAVCTHPNYRGMGLCREIHSYIKEKCRNENARYFVHPASGNLNLYYSRLGMVPVTSYYTVKTVPYKMSGVRAVTSSEYARLRDLYFGGFGYYPWSESALSFMAENGIAFFSAQIDGIECGGAVDGDTIIELCCPDHLIGRAASAFLPETCGLGSVRLFSEPNHQDTVGIMSFSSESAYLNLFFE